MTGNSTRDIEKNKRQRHYDRGGGGTMAKRLKALVFLLQVGLMPVQILVAAMKGKNVRSIGKPPAPNSVPYVPQHIDGRPAI